jgi:2'-5' RNA ligase
MRSFVAINFSHDIIEKITDIIQYFKSQTPDKALKWVAPDNLHMTVKFLGEVPEGNIERVKEIILEALQGRHAFEIGVEGLGMYPNKNNPRVIWLGIQGGDPLVEIHKRLDAALLEAAITPDKHSLSPHLTIARIRRNAERETVQDVGKTFSQFKVDSLGTCLIDQVHLYKSILTPEGPIYTSLLSIPLNKV